METVKNNSTANEKSKEISKVEPVIMKKTKAERDPAIHKNTGFQKWIERFAEEKNVSIGNFEKMQRVKKQIEEITKKEFGKPIQPIFLSEESLKKLRLLYVFHSRMEAYDDDLLHDDEGTQVMDELLKLLWVETELAYEDVPIWDIHCCENKEAEYTCRNCETSYCSVCIEDHECSEQEEEEEEGEEKDQL